MRNALLLTLALLAACRHGNDPRLDAPTHVEVCRQNLRAVYRGLVDFDGSFGGAPTASGAGFLYALVSSGVWEPSPENLARLTCPGPGARPVPDGFDPASPDSLGRHGEQASAYAARDTQAHPLEKFPTGGATMEILAACDNAAGMNHEGVMNLLYADGTVVTLSIEQEIERGRLPAGTEHVPVAKDSPVEDLRKLVGSP